MIQLLISFTTSSIALLFGHVSLWFILIKLFPVLENFQVILALVLLFLFFSVIISSLLIHKKDGPWSRSYYFLSSFWVGIIVNMFLMGLIIIILKELAAAFAFSLPLSLIKIIFFAGTLLLSALGVYQAFVPKVFSYEVAIKDLPESWHNKTVVQISDVHLGPIHRQKFFNRLLKKIQQLNPEAVFITGDLFDGMKSEFSWVNNFFVELKAPKGIYYSFGNHDLYLGFNRVVNILKDSPITILADKMVVVDGLQIIGINFSFDKNFDLQAAILKQVGYDRQLPSILLFHEPRHVSLAKEAEIDLQLSGHTHNGQLFPFNYIVKLVHGGYGHGLFKDQDFSLIVNRGVGTWGPPMRTSGRGEITKIILKKK
ncbi:metallophosphoesterase [Candidatus Falkowbacteria bacterium]|jgi:predicted MPP superfamily phosphohydrolase|nr:metallophosphoesterase [Candidatus Falkowbacteria bacterium]